MSFITPVFNLSLGIIFSHSLPVAKTFWTWTFSISMNIILGIQAFKYRLKSWESWENFAGRFPTWFLCGKKNCQRLLVNCSFARQIEHGIKYACGCLTFYFRCMIGCMQNLLVHWPRLKLYENVKSRTLNRVFQVDFVV